MCILLFTLHLQSPADYPEGPYCPHHKYCTTGSPMASRLPRTRALGGSEVCWCRPLSHPNSWEWRAMLPPPSMNSWMMRSRATALASATQHLATIHPESALWRMLRDSHRWLWSLHKLTPLRTHVWGPSRSHKGTPRSYDNGGRTSRHLRRRTRCSTLRPMRVTQ